ncbi:ParB/RepB/Spo0J family partition protein [Mobilicoccus massiliensis]|uniref:ParB/RepB/Spo0J family partition protein n=1 Tax=Mobilicoccus massiliensis TaxID=1522310 RepID=UPI00058EEC86|nr:ParB/RepB/Spo0J family partition protein [Mobilicoccus massiliensis]
MTERRRGLGRGLGALIPDSPSGVTRPRDMFFTDGAHTVSRSTEAVSRETGAARAFPVPDPANTTSTPAAAAGGGVPEGLESVPGASFAHVPLDRIVPNARQPREVFDEDDLGELVDSIRQIGVLQPIVVRPLEGDGAGEARYELVMGERRWRASRAAGLDAVPAIIRSTSDDDMLRDALLENLHRAQLNPLEEAAAYQQLLEDFGCTHEDLASRLARSRPQITNTLRLLRLPPLVARRVAAGVLSAGHARALLGLQDPAAMERLAQRIVAEGLSVRSVEEIIALGEAGSPTRRRAPRAVAHHPELDDVASSLADRLDTRVAINMGRKRGKLTVEFASVDDLHRILDVLGASEAAPHA